MMTGTSSGDSLPRASVWETDAEEDLILEAEPGPGATARLVQALDTCLRRYHRVREFTQDGRCLLRVGTMAAPFPARLSDGTLIEAGETIGILHFWNEHLIPFSSGGPNLGWAKRMAQGMQYSLASLACYLESDPQWREVRAFYACAPLSANQRVWQAAGRFGFDLVPMQRSLPQDVRDLADSFVAFALTLAFNPAALRRRSFLRKRHQLWISRGVLMARYRTHPSNGSSC